MWRWILPAMLASGALFLPNGAAAGAPAAAEKPPQAQSAVPHPAAPTAARRKLPFLGAATSEAPVQDRQSLGLGEGVGLVVQFVSPETPAKQAGLRRDDVLYKLDDQLLINNPQFRVLLRNHKPGDTVTLSLIRGGKPLSLPVRLGETEVPVPPPGAGPCGVGVGAPCPWVTSAQSEPPPSPGRFMANYEDAQHVLFLSSDERGKYLLAKDKQGVVVFQGPVSTPRDRRAVPAVLLPKLESMETPPDSGLGPAARSETR